MQRLTRGAAAGAQPAWPRAGQRRARCARCRSGVNVVASASAQQATPDTAAAAPLAVSRRIAAARAGESQRGTADAGGDALFVDPYADLLAGWGEPAAAPAVSPGSSPSFSAAAAAREAACDVIATAHVDALLLRATAVSAINRINSGDYRQVVLLGDAMDTRPFRLPWPPGTALFLVAPRAAHAAAEAALRSERAAQLAAAQLAAAGAPGGPAEAAAAAAGAGGAATAAGGGGAKRRGLPPGPRPPPGCLLRRVPVDLHLPDGAAQLGAALGAVGFRADRLSVWAVQGLAGLGLEQQDVVGLLAEAAHCAAFHSLLLGELPPLPPAAAANALAECGLLGVPLAFGTPDTSYGRWRAEWDAQATPAAPDIPAAAAAAGNSGGSGCAGGLAAPQRWLFASQQIRLSAAQMETLEAHRSEAEALDEDYFDNFS